MKVIDPYDHIVWSADVKNEATLMALLDSMPLLKHVKIDRLFMERSGLGLLERLNNRGVKVFDDAKITEIGSKLVGVARNHLQYMPWMLNCMAGCISTGQQGMVNPERMDGLKCFAETCLIAGTRPCGVTVLTTKTPEVVGDEFNGRSPTDQVLWYMEKLVHFGFTDAVCSPWELEAIRAEPRFNCINLNTPGIRPEGADQDEQTRVGTPQWAIAKGADRLIIGRPITDNGDPAENLARLAESIATI